MGEPFPGIPFLVIREALSNLVARAAAALQESGAIPAIPLPQPEILDPKQPEHGDFSTNLAMVASKTVGKNPREFGEMLAEKLRAFPEFTEVEVAGPGFINLRIDPDLLTRALASVQERDFVWFPAPSSGGQRINVEFVSVNPNGPITIGSGRGAAYGSTLCNVLQAAGHTVHREYYINDGVNSEQMRLFAESVRAHLLGEPLPEKGYKGDYVELVAETIPYRDPSAAHISGQEKTLALSEFPLVLRGHSLLASMLEISPNVSQAELEDTIAYLDSETGPLVSERGIDWAFSRTRGAGYSNDLSGWLKRGAVAMEACANDSFSTSRNFIRTEAARAIITNIRSGQVVLKPEKLQLAQEALGVADSLDSLEARIASSEVKLGSEPLRNHYAVKPISEIQELSQSVMLEKQRDDLANFGVLFDTWFSEQSLHDSGEVEKSLQALLSSQVADNEPVRTKLKLGKGSKIEEVEREPQTQASEDDAEGEGETVWLRSTKFADDMDRVLRRRDGRLTYIASDVSYHRDKFNRPENADRLITILGPDHHGYIGRLTAVVGAMLLADGQVNRPEASTGPLNEIDALLYRDETERDACQAALALARKRLHVQIYQLVRFLKDGKPAPMRKRDGNIYALIDLMREIGTKVKPNGTQEDQMEAGKDVARFFYLMRSHDTTFDFDLDLAEKQSDENPVFYVQYAHARICSVLDKARDAGFVAAEDTDLSVLRDPKELTLIKKILDLPNEVARAAEDYGVHRLATYAIELARCYHSFYDTCRVIQPEEPDLSRARVRLCDATRIGLVSTFRLLGISAPSRMDRAE